MKAKIIPIVITIILLSSVIVIPFQSSYAFDLAGLDLNLTITPSKIESGKAEHKIGYVSLTHKGILVNQKEDAEIKLSSDYPNIVSVPESIIIEKGSSYTQFSIKTTDEIGESTISATVNNLISSQKVTIGSSNSYLPDNLSLNLSLPSENMHIDSDMPFTVFLKTPDGAIVRAPRDIDIRLEYDKNNAFPTNDTLTIKKDTYYAWGVLHSGNNPGSAYLRAIQDELDLDAAKSIRLTSTLPTALQINVFPKLISEDIGRDVNAFVSLLDANGNPTVAPNDIPLEFFVDSRNRVSEAIDTFSKTSHPVIKKGEFGYLFKQKLDVIGTEVPVKYTIGVSAKGYGIATDYFKFAKQILTFKTIEKFNNQISKIDLTDTTEDQVKINYPYVVVMFGPDKIPPNSDSVIGYQIGVLEDNDDDDNTLYPGHSTNYEVETDPSVCDETRTNEDILSGNSDSTNTDNTSTSNTNSNTNSDTTNQDQAKCEIPIPTIDYLPDKYFYPIQANEHSNSDGTFFEKTALYSSDKNLVSIVDAGILPSTQSNGFGIIHSGSYSGTGNVSATISGVGSQSVSTTVINSLEQKETRMFSPVGDDILLTTSDGYFDVFLVAIDQSDRPKKQFDDTQYLVSPTNSIVEIKKDQTFSLAKIRGEDFSNMTNTETTTTKNKSDNDQFLKETKFEVTQVGSGSIKELDTKKTFKIQPSASIQITLPNPLIGAKTSGNLGVVQLVDLQGNPIVATKNMPTKILSSDGAVLRILDSPTIPKGYSYAYFDIEALDKLGTSTLTASARGITPSTLEVNTHPTSSNLVVSVGDLPESLKIGEPSEITVYVDDSNQNSVSDVRVMASSNDMVEFEAKEIVTGDDGSAKLKITVTGGTQVEITLDASKKDYSDATKSFFLDASPAAGSNSLLSGFAFGPWMIYVAIAAVVIIGIFVALFFRKTKEIEEWDEEDEI